MHELKLILIHISSGRCCGLICVENTLKFLKKEV